VTVPGDHPGGPGGPVEGGLALFSASPGSASRVRTHQQLKPRRRFASPGPAPSLFAPWWVAPQVEKVGLHSRGLLVIQRGGGHARLENCSGQLNDLEVCPSDLRSLIGAGIRPAGGS